MKFETEIEELFISLGDFEKEYKSFLTSLTKEKEKLLFLFELFQLLDKDFFAELIESKNFGSKMPNGKFNFHFRAQDLNQAKKTYRVDLDKYGNEENSLKNEATQIWQDYKILSIDYQKIWVKALLDSKLKMQKDLSEFNSLTKKQERSKSKALDKSISMSYDDSLLQSYINNYNKEPTEVLPGINDLEFIKFPLAKTAYELEAHLSDLKLKECFISLEHYQKFLGNSFELTSNNPRVKKLSLKFSRTRGSQTRFQNITYLIYTQHREKKNKEFPCSKDIYAKILMANFESYRNAGIENTKKKIRR